MGAGASTAHKLGADMHTWSKQDVASALTDMGTAYNDYRDTALSHGVDGTAA